jgi:DNA-binding transcriptional ArsR family regulator
MNQKTVTDQSHPVMSAETMEMVARRFHVLGCASRVRIINSLMGGPLGMNAVKDATGLEQSNLSRQVKELELGGWVAKERIGQSVTVRIADPILFEMCRLVCGGMLDSSH